jgi:phospholipid transport system substrate-binding protein
MTSTSRRPFRVLTRRTLMAGLVVAAALPLGLGISPVAAQTGNGAENFVQSLGDRAIQILRSGASRDAKVDQLKVLLNQAVNIELVARLVAGRYWRDMSQAQQRQYVDLFRQLAVKTMADGLSNYSGQTFKVTGNRVADERDTVVSTLINQPNGGQAYKVDWRVRALNGGYSIVDIVAEGVSMLVTQRNEVNSIAGNQGINGLLAEMQRRLQTNQPLKAG